jgi:hypothetical protein
MRVYKIISTVCLISVAVSFAQEIERIDPLEFNRNIINNSFNSSNEQKSPFLAVVYSLVLPGAGELYANRFDVGRYSFAAETTLWILYFGMENFGYHIQDDARSFARVHAGFDDINKNDNYYIDVSNHNNTFEFNDRKLRERNSKALYDPYSNMSWQWDSDANRIKFRKLRVSSATVLNNTKFVATAIIANRLFSAINAARLTRNYNKQLNISASPTFYNKTYDGFIIKFSAKF